MEKSKVIFGNEMSPSVIRKGYKNQKKFIRKFGDDRNQKYHLKAMPVPALESLGVQKITAALECFDEADFKTLLAELKKQKISLTLTQKDEWEDYFNQYKTDCNALSAQIAATAVPSIAIPHWVLHRIHPHIL